MRLRAGWWIPWLLTALCVGCGAPETSLRPVLEPRGLPQEAWQDGDDAHAQPGELRGRPLSVDDVVRVALLNNPELRAIGQELFAQTGRVEQTAAFGNPEVGAEARFRAGGATVFEGRLHYDFGRLLRQAALRRGARAGQEAARLEAAVAVVRFVHEVRTAWVEHVADVQALAVEHDVLRAARGVERAAELLHEAGNVDEMQVLEARVFAAEARVAVMQAEAAVADSRHRLHERMGLSPEADDWQVPARLPQPAPLEGDRQSFDDGPLDVATFEARVLERNLRLAELEQRARRSEAEVGIARWEGWLPRLGLGVTTEYDDDRWSTGPSIELALPLFDRQRYALDAARAEGLAAGHRARAERLRTSAVARQVWARLEATHGTTVWLTEEVLPLRGQLLEATLRKFNAMDVGLFDLLRVRREEFHVQRDAARALRAYWMARADAEFLLAGGSVPGLAPGAVAGRDSD